MLPLKQYHFHNRFQLQEYSGILEKALFISLAGLSISFFFSSWGVSRFSIWSIYILLVQRYVIGYEPVRSLPKYLLLATALYLLSFIASSIISADKTNVVTGLKDYRVLLLAGLLFTAPLSGAFRKYILILFFISALFGGLIGIFQYFGLHSDAFSNRAHGLAPHPIIYGTQLALACVIGILYLVLRPAGLFHSNGWVYFLVAIVAITVLGILVSLSRGVWLALIVASLGTLFFYNRRKALIFIFCSIALVGLVFVLSSPMRGRALSIATAIAQPKSDADSTGTRLELWKGALLIFRESPILGTGIGDFRSDINTLIETKKIDPIYEHPRGNAHSSFFHALATRGLLGFLSLLGLYSGLMIFGFQSIRAASSPGGYIVLSVTLVLLVGGLTVPYLGGIGMGVVLTEYCFLFGLLGPLSS